MPAMPDLLLTSASPLQNKVKALVPAREPSKEQPSSFAKVYERERQGGVESARSPAPQQEDSAVEATPGTDTASVALASDGADVAADGNTLPLPETELDPLIAMALQGMQGQAQAQEAVVTQEEGAFELNSPMSADQSLAQEPLVTLEMPNTALLTAPAPEVQPEVSPVLRAGQAAALGALAVGLHNASTDSVPVTDEAELEAWALSLDAEQLEGLKDSAQPQRPELFVNKLNAAAAVAGQPPAARIPVVPGTPLSIQQSGWGEAVVDKVMWMSSQNLKSAEIQLNPAELGRLEVRVNLAQDQTQVTFASANAGVRDALEMQMHRLREMFAQQGMSLGDANVSDQAQNRGEQAREEYVARGVDEHGIGDDELGAQTLRSESLAVGRGLVDYYA